MSSPLSLLLFQLQLTRPRKRSALKTSVSFLVRGYGGYVCEAITQGDNASCFLTELILVANFGNTRTRPLQSFDIMIPFRRDCDDLPHVFKAHHEYVSLKTCHCYNPQRRCIFFEGISVLPNCVPISFARIFRFTLAPLGTNVAV